MDCLLEAFPRIKVQRLKLLAPLQGLGSKITRADCQHCIENIVVIGGSRDGYQYYVESVVVIGHQAAEPREIKLILHKVFRDFCKKLVALQTTEPLGKWKWTRCRQATR